mmetsp:Transcript_90684/g.259395  ORF Transcript_90684/g.259395 Transcript_90684/m.259395 type:complete len:268 (-) Transcript_90684:1570-2373(-)
MIAKPTTTPPMVGAQPPQHLSPPSPPRPRWPRGCWRRPAGPRRGRPAPPPGGLSESPRTAKWSGGRPASPSPDPARLPPSMPLATRPHKPLGTQPTSAPRRPNLQGSGGTPRPRPRTPSPRPWPRCCRGAWSHRSAPPRVLDTRCPRPRSHARGRLARTAARRGAKPPRSWSGQNDAPPQLPSGPAAPGRPAQYSRTLPHPACQISGQRPRCALSRPPRCADPPAVRVCAAPRVRRRSARSCGRVRPQADPRRAARQHASRGGPPTA